MFPPLWNLARERNLPVGGKDFKTGQTLMKTLLAPGLKARLLGLSGWFSTNILGNRDGEVSMIRNPLKQRKNPSSPCWNTSSSRTCIPSCIRIFTIRSGSITTLRGGDNKEGWDNIDIFGWMGYPMQIKVNFLCRDSILAAPIVLDLVLFTDLAQRTGMRGVQEWLSFYFKSPMTAPRDCIRNTIFSSN